MLGMAGRCLHAALDLDWIEGGAQWPNLRSIIQINSEVISRSSKPIKNLSFAFSDDLILFFARKYF